MTTENKHTPGPWHVTNEWNVSGPEYEVANGSIMVRNDDESTANARLISAAPDLLAALERLATFEAFTFEGWGDDNAEVTARVEYARAVITKARGQ